MVRVANFCNPSFYWRRL